jgi:hypothetical protein
MALWLFGKILFIRYVLLNCMDWEGWRWVTLFRCFELRFFASRDWHGDTNRRWLALLLWAWTTLHRRWGWEVWSALLLVFVIIRTGSRR